MYKHLLKSAGDIDWMALLPLLIFVAFFIVILVLTITRKKSHIRHMKELPFEDDPKKENQHNDE
ncbi:MAG: hypothetical protein R3275_05690 [Saprospiraceae bacterium]|nr:hypothetical protein [Saprospiraceae bacterium]